MKPNRLGSLNSTVWPDDITKITWSCGSASRDRSPIGATWNQPDIPQVKAFDDTIRKRSNRAASARDWFGYAAVRTLAAVANQEKSLDPVVLAHALQGFTLPPDIALSTGRTFFRDSDHQLMSPILVGEVHHGAPDPG